MPFAWIVEILGGIAAQGLGDYVVVSLAQDEELHLFVALVVRRDLLNWRISIS
jgi:hypothetical protein